MNVAPHPTKLNPPAGAGTILRSHRRTGKRRLTLRQVAKRCSSLDHGELGKLERGQRLLTGETLAQLVVAYERCKKPLEPIEVERLRQAAGMDHVRRAELRREQLKRWVEVIGAG